MEIKCFLLKGKQKFWKKPLGPNLSSMKYWSSRPYHFHMQLHGLQWYCRNHHMIYELSVHMCIHVEQWPDHWLVWDQHILKMRQTWDFNTTEWASLSNIWAWVFVSNVSVSHQSLPKCFNYPFSCLFFSGKRTITVSLNIGTFKRESNLWCRIGLWAVLGLVQKH